jgi:hypothetical protein
MALPGLSGIFSDLKKMVKSIQGELVQLKSKENILNKCYFMAGLLLAQGPNSIENN